MPEMISKDDVIEIERFQFGAPTEAIGAAVDRAGGVIVENVFTPEQVAQINADFEPHLHGDMGAVEGGDEFWAEFYGRKTRRVMSAVSISETYRQNFLENDITWDYARAVVSPSLTGGLRITTDGVYEVNPGEKAQIIHRDGDMIPYFSMMGPDGPNMVCNMLIALSDITEEMGATRIIPGSHKWPATDFAGDYDAQFPAEKSIPVELKAGSMCIINGRVVHGGGANTSNKPRRVLACGFHPDWIMPEQAYVWSVSMEQAKTFSPRLRKATCFASVPEGMWKYNFDDLNHFLKL